MKTKPLFVWERMSHTLLLLVYFLKNDHNLREYDTVLLCKETLGVLSSSSPLWSDCQI